MRQDLNSRRDSIFDLIVRSYIETADPVGSRTISRHSELGLSAASIRNVMADLEELGFLKQPHTSAGRVPTDKGYRYWVDRLMQREELSEEEREWILSELSQARTISALAEKISKVISEIAQNAAVVYFKNFRRVSFLNHLLTELVRAERLEEFFEEEPEMFIDGASRVFDQPEFQDLKKMRSLLQAFDAKIGLFEVFLRDLEEQGVQVHIGSENLAGDLTEISLVVKDCYLANTPIGSVAVLGPTRMHYPKVVSVVEYVADAVSGKLERF